MAFLCSFAFLLSLAAAAFSFPHNTINHILRGSKAEFESSGSGPDHPVRGIVRVVQLDPRALAQSGLFRRGLAPRRVPAMASRLSFPAFLSQGGIPGSAPKALKVPVSPLRQLNPDDDGAEMDLKKKQGQQMWQRAMSKGDHGKTMMSLPLSLKDAKQTCTAVAFTQRVTSEGCDTVTVHNKLCFGQCSSLFVPSQAEFAGVAAHRRLGPCSRCAPSRSRTVVVPLRCGGGEVREKRVMVVEECKCETGREERNAEATHT
ncbi:DAN domain family member 5 [Genypterus blacodes]|uniref:DAN domain family member 5 n=1 Tax=Genypterus blacodes TaxID=154954 RepID=UPI003F76C487